MEELNERALVRSLVGLLLCSIAGATAAFFIPFNQPRLILAFAVAAGVVVAAAIYLLGTRTREPKQVRAHGATAPQAGVPEDVADVAPATPQHRIPGTFLLIRIEKRTQLPEPRFISAAMTPWPGPWLWEAQQDGVVEEGTRWTASSKENEKVAVVEFPIVLKESISPQFQVERALQKLKLAGPWVRAWEIFRSVAGGQLPYHLDRLHGVVVCVPHTYLRDEGDTNAIELVFRTIGQATRSKYPTYVVFTGVEEVTGCSEALTWLSREGSDVTAQPVGYFFRRQPEGDDFRRAAHTVVDAFASWLPFLLDRENDSAESSLRLAESMRRAKLRAELAQKRQRMFELVPRLETLAEELGDRLKALRAQCSTSRWGPEFRGVLFSGMVAAHARVDVGFTYTRGELVHRQRAFLARFLTQDLPELRTSSARVLGPVARAWWVRGYMLAAAAAIVVTIIVGTLAVLSLRGSNETGSTDNPASSVAQTTSFNAESPAQ